MSMKNRNLGRFHVKVFRKKVSIHSTYKVFIDIASWRSIHVTCQVKKSSAKIRPYYQ